MLTLSPWHRTEQRKQLAQGNATTTEQRGAAGRGGEPTALEGPGPRRPLPRAAPRQGCITAELFCMESSCLLYPKLQIPVGLELAPMIIG